MELEVLKDQGIDLKIESELTINAEFKLHEVATEIDLLDAEGEIKKANIEKKSLSAKIKPIKQAIDDFKSKFLLKEKNEIAKVDSFVKLQEAKITEYKRMILEKQKKLKEEAERRAREEAERLRKEEEAKIEAERKAKEEELAKIKVSEEPLHERSTKAMEINEEIKNLGELKVPEIEIQPEKVVLKKDEIRTKKVFTIQDEKSFIRWALQNNLGLLKIEISKAAFNEWVKREENQSHDFLTYTEEIL